MPWEMAIILKIFTGSNLVMAQDDTVISVLHEFTHSTSRLSDLPNEPGPCKQVRATGREVLITFRIKWPLLAWVLGVVIVAYVFLVPVILPLLFFAVEQNI